MSLLDEVIALCRDWPSAEIGVGTFVHQLRVKRSDVVKLLRDLGLKPDQGLFNVDQVLERATKR
jgi:hypothetical protein